MTHCYISAVATATAHANIALVKYWGKSQVALNIPAAGSLSLTLEALSTRTQVSLQDGAEDQLYLDGAPAEGRALARVSAFMDLIRDRVGSTARVRVDSSNNFPTAAGLASSASAFAALARAGSAAFGLELSPRELSILARRGSGSAARSVFGGFVRMQAGQAADGSEAFARPLSELDLELHAVIAVAAAGPKKVGSTDGMEHTRQTSPYHAAWLQQVESDLEATEAALKEKDFDRLAELVEGSCLAMHADAMAARPGILYFQAPTLAAIERVRALRAAGTEVFFTVDAGPHLVAFTPPAQRAAVAAALSDCPGVAEVITSAPGAGAALESTG